MSPSRRITQRELNLAHQIFVLADTGGLLSRKLTDSQNHYGLVTEDDCKQFEDVLFDTLVAVRQYRHKSNPIEVKGSRA